MSTCVNIFVTVGLFCFVSVSCIETVNVVTDGTINVYSNEPALKLWCNFTVSMRRSLRASWFNGGDIVAHYEDNMTQVHPDYSSYVQAVGSLAGDDASIKLNVAELVAEKGASPITYKCWVIIYNGTNSVIDEKNTTVIILDPPPTGPNTGEPSDGLSTGAIVGIVIGSLLLVGAIIGAIVYFGVCHGVLPGKGAPTATASLDTTSVTLNSAIINLKLGKSLIRELTESGKGMIRAETRYTQGSTSTHVITQSSQLAPDQISDGSCKVSLVNLTPGTFYLVQGVGLSAGDSVWEFKIGGVNTFTTRNGQGKTSNKSEPPVSLLNAVPKGRQLPPLDARLRV